MTDGKEERMRERERLIHSISLSLSLSSTMHLSVLPFHPPLSPQIFWVHVRGAEERERKKEKERNGEDGERENGKKKMK